MRDELLRYMQAQEEYIKVLVGYNEQLQAWVWYMAFGYLLTFVLVYIFVVDPRFIPNLITRIKRWLKRWF